MLNFSRLIVSLKLISWDLLIVANLTSRLNLEKNIAAVVIIVALHLDRRGVDLHLSVVVLDCV